MSRRKSGYYILFLALGVPVLVILVGIMSTNETTLSTNETALSANETTVAPKKSLIDDLIKKRRYYATKDGLPVRDGYVSKVDINGHIRSGISANPGEVVRFHLNGGDRIAASTARIVDIFGNVVYETDPFELFSQSTSESDEPWLYGHSYDVTFSWRIPEDLESGVYALNVDKKTYYSEGPRRKAPYIFVIVGSDRDKADITVLHATNTFNAYSKSLGRSLYTHPIKMHEVSFLRPMNYSKPGEWVTGIQWLTRQFSDLSVDHITDFEMEEFRSIESTKILFIIGHSEYWTRKARINLDKFILNGGHVIIASGNSIWWQVRYGQDGNSLITYKLGASPVGLERDPIQDPLLKV